MARLAWAGESARPATAQEISAFLGGLVESTEPVLDAFEALTEEFCR